LCFVGVVLLHECGHALFARRQGLRPVALFPLLLQERRALRFVRN